MRGEESETGRAASRRDLLKGAVAAGAVTAAWVTPSIATIDAAAAAATTMVPAGTYRAMYDRIGGVFVRVPAVNGSGSCRPSGWNNLVDYPSSLNLTDTATLVSLSLSAGNCVFNADGRAECSSVCFPGSPSVDFKTMTWLKSLCTTGYTRLRVVITCT